MLQTGIVNLSRVIAILAYSRRWKWFIMYCMCAYLYYDDDAPDAGTWVRFRLSLINNNSLIERWLKSYNCLCLTVGRQLTFPLQPLLYSLMLCLRFLSYLLMVCGSVFSVRNLIISVAYLSWWFYSCVLVANHLLAKQLQQLNAMAAAIDVFSRRNSHL